MSTRTFFSYLFFITVVILGLLAGLYVAVPPAQAHGKFAIASVALFVLVCVLLYFTGASAARSSNKYAFTNLVSVSVFGKMVAAVAFLFIYQKMAQPTNEWFVGIFLLCYVTYTAYEVWFMTRLAR
jgi:hypothetical protein